MGILVIIVSLILFFLGNKYFKTYANPVSVFNGAWILCLCCCEYFIFAYDADKVSTRMYLYILLSILVFSIFSLIFKANQMRKGEKNLIEWNNTDDCLNYSLIIIFNLIAFIILLPSLKSSLIEMQATSLVNVRANRMLGTGTGFVWQTIIKNVFIFPVYLTTIYIAIDAFIFNYSKHKWKLILLAIVDAILYTLTYLGRLMIIQILLFIVFTYFLYRLSSSYTISEKTKIMLKRVKKLVIALILFSVIALFYITSQRKSNDDFGVFYTVVTYFGGSVKFCDIELSLVDKANDFVWGGGLFSGLWDYILMVVQKFFNIDFLRPQEIIGVYNGDITSIGGGMVMTAFATIILNMYLDGGILGIIFDSFVLAMIGMIIYKKMILFPDTRHRLFCTQMLMIISSSALHWEGNRITAFAIFIFFILFVRNKYGRKITFGRFRLL